MRVMLIIASLGPGGAERVLTLLAGELVNRGHEVWLVTLAPASEDFFAVDGRVRRVALGLVGESRSQVQALWANARRLLTLRRAVAVVKPAVTLSFITSTNVLAVLASLGLPVRRVVSERVDPEGHREGRVWAALRRLVYRHASVVVVQTEGIASWYRPRLPRATEVAVIANPVQVRARADQTAEGSAPFVLAGGRLVHQKGFDLLIRAFGVLTQRAAGAPGLRLQIAGEGSEGPRLRQLVSELALDARVDFLGRVADLPALMARALLFVLPSRYEGLPNVLLEALSVGVPCIATDCPGASREILGEGAYGLLVAPEDPNALAEAMARLSTDRGLRQHFAAAGPAAVKPLALERIVTQWEQVLAGS